MFHTTWSGGGPSAKAVKSATFVGGVSAPSDFSLNL